MYHIIPYAALSFLLNFFWESYHGIYLYADGSRYGQTIKNYLAINTRASIEDMISLLLIFATLAFVTDGVNWWKNLTVKKLGGFAVLSIGGAYLVEFYATEVAIWWSYNDAMPMVFGVGLSPLLQIFVTGLAAVGLMRLMAAKSQ